MTPADQIERKKMTNPRLCDRRQKYLRFREKASEMLRSGQNVPRPTFLKVLLYTRYNELEQLPFL